MPQNLWPRDTVKAKAVQDALKKRVKVVPFRKIPEFIAAVDASFLDHAVIAVASLFRYRELICVEDVFSIKKRIFPYIPGLLSFREGPAMVAALKKLRIKPDIVLFDGQGIAHPKGIGIASHIGVLLNIPTIGCAKSRLIGEYHEPDAARGSSSHLIFKGKRVGTILRTRDHVKPVFVSPGHMTDMKTSVEIVMKCTSHYRLPEPLRRADHLSKTLRKELSIV